MRPQAHLCHQTTGRLRFRIPSKKQNTSYFSALKDALSRFGSFDQIEVNSRTGSVLVVGKQIDADGLLRYAEEKQLFALNETENQTAPLSQRLVKPVGEFSDSLSRFTGGELDLPGMAFLLALCIGVFEIARGNFRVPPWYTAFWYAFGIFTKSVIDKHGSTDKDDK